MIVKGFEYGCDTDAGYIALKDIQDGDIVITREAKNVEALLDFDMGGKLVGIELLYLGIKKEQL